MLITFRCIKLSKVRLVYWEQTQDECNHLIELARPSLVKSTVVDSATGKSKDSRCVLMQLFLNVAVFDSLFGQVCQLRYNCNFG